MKRILFQGILLLSLCTSCQFKERLQDAAIGSPVKFAAGNSYFNGLETRTVYSGLDENGSAVGESSSWERIDWVNGDLIRILSPQNTSGGQTADYGVMSHTETASGDGKGSYATLTSASPDILTWIEENQTFYALYPSPATTGVDPAKVSLVAGTNLATITATLPATQVVTASSSAPLLYKPDMNYAYMWASQSASAGQAVSLSFAPLMTAFEITVDSKDDATMSLYSFTMSSSSTALVGDFTATISGSTCTVTSVPTFSDGVNNVITVNFGGSANPTVVTKGSPITFTVFALPQTIEDVTLAFETSKGTRLLALKQNNEFVPFTAQKKIRITGVTVPGSVWTYTLSDLVASDITMDSSNGDATLATGFMSYRTKVSSGVTEAVPFHWEWSADGSTGWTTGLPDWLTGGSSQYSGGNTGEDLVLGVKAILNSVTDASHNSLAAKEEKTDLDLSMVDPSKSDNTNPGGWNYPRSGSVPYETANCYVVRSPGTFKIPLVYGNSYTGGAVNRFAFQSKTSDSHSGSWRTTDQTLTSTGKPNHYRLAYYKEHKGESISSAGDLAYPWLTNNYSRSSHTYSARLIWEDAPGLVQDVAIASNEDYLTFAVPVDNICQGNALVAVLIDNEIAWSWHIWVTDKDLSAQFGASSIGNSGSPYYQFSGYPLGWCDTRTVKYDERSCYVRIVQERPGAPYATSARKITQTGLPETTILGNNTYYQWGRKDPFSGGMTGNQAKPIYPSDAIALTLTSSSIDLKDGILNPNTFYYSNENLNYNWLGRVYENLWSSLFNSPPSGNSDIVGNDVRTCKTVYDPCPVGFKVPTTRAFFGLKNSSHPEWGFEWTSTPNPPGIRKANNTSWFIPATGYRGGSDGIHNKYGTEGVYWSSVMMSASAHAYAAAMGLIRFYQGSGMSYDLPFGDGTAMNGFSVLLQFYENSGW